MLEFLAMQCWRSGWWAWLGLVGCLLVGRPAWACLSGYPPELMRVSVDGVSWVGWDFRVMRCADSSRAFVVGRTFHADSLAERLFRDSLEMLVSKAFALGVGDGDGNEGDGDGDGDGDGYPVAPRGVRAQGEGRVGCANGWYNCIEESEPRATSALIGLMARRFDDTGTRVPKSWLPHERTVGGGMNFRARADFLNPTTVFSVVQRKFVVGRLRRAHLLGGILTYHCGNNPRWNCGNNPDWIGECMAPDGEASENVFARVAHDPEHCALFGQTWTGLWYFVDGKTGTFRDVVVPDTAVEWEESDPGWIGFPRWSGLFVVLAGVVLVAMAVWSFAEFPAWWAIKLVVAVLALVVARMVPTPTLHYEEPKPLYLGPSSAAGVDLASLPFPRPPTVPYLDTGTGLVCGDLENIVRLEFAEPGGGRLDVIRGNKLTKSVALRGGDAGDPKPVVAWDSSACTGFAQTGPKTFVQFDARTGSLRQAFLRDRAHFFAWPDSTPEVPQWWRDHLLLPPGREPDILLLPPPSRLEFPLFLWRRWLRFVMALLLAWLCLLILPRRRCASVTTKDQFQPKSLEDENP